MRRGEVYWYRFRAPDKRRPVVVLTRSELIDHLGTVTVAAVTSTVRGVGSEVPLGVADGMPRACAINLHHVFTLQKTGVGPYLTTLPAPILARVDRALVFALGVTAPDAFRLED